MGTALRRHRSNTRAGDRLRVHAAIQLTTADGKPVAPLARCVEIGLGGLRVVGDEHLAPGTRVHVAVRLSHGIRVEVDGRVAWSRETLHPALFGAPGSRVDDAEFGIAFDAAPTERLLPIARLFAARDGEKRRARRLRRLHGLPIHA